MAIKWLVPPLDADPVKQYWHRVRVSIATMIALFGVVAITVLAWGWIPGYGFAKSLAVEAVLTEIRANRAETLGDQLFNLQIKQCAAATSGEKQLLEQQIIWNMRKYRDLTQQEYPLPACTTL